MSKPPRPSLPDLTDQDLEEIFGQTFRAPDLPTSVYKLSRIPRDTLDAMPYIERQWCCAAKDCPRQTTVRDYGHATHFYWHRKWTNRDCYYLCSRCNKLYGGWINSLYHDKNLPLELRSREEAKTLLGYKPVNFST